VVRSRWALAGVGLGLASLIGACAGPSDEQIMRGVQGQDPEVELLGQTHRGPPVVAGRTGTARFAGPLLSAFDADHAMETVHFVDRFYRAPGNDGYEASMDHVAARLRAAGYGAVEGFEIFELETPLTARGPQRGQRIPSQAWTPKSGRIAMVNSDGSEIVLHEFSESGDADRCMLPVNSPSADGVVGGVSFHLDDLGAGEVLVTDASPRLPVLMRAQSSGAAAVVSSYLDEYNRDPSGADRHLDAIQFRTLPAGTSIPVIMISQRSMEAIRKLKAHDSDLRLSLSATVEFADRPLRTLCARVVGTDRPDEAVVIGSHVQEPGACDNASGVAGLCESASNLLTLIQAGKIGRPSRSLVFLWGDEFRQTETWLDETELTAVVGFSSDMTGESSDTGAIALLERMPDPGATLETPLAPDEHTPWGSTEVTEEELTPNGLAIVARCAMLDVAGLEPGWVTADHPYEGGSDHDVFIERGIPAALFWHFTDFTYHTSLDRVEFVDPGEMRRTGTALMASALAVADPLPGDLERYLLSLNEEQRTRIDAARAAGLEDQARMWKDWCFGARQWLRVECLRIPSEDEQ
jgi:hypothetical protein